MFTVSRTSLNVWLLSFVLIGFVYADGLAFLLLRGIDSGKVNVVLGPIMFLVSITALILRNKQGLLILVLLTSGIGSLFLIGIYLVNGGSHIKLFRDVLYLWSLLSIIAYFVSKDISELSRLSRIMFLIGVPLLSIVGVILGVTTISEDRFSGLQISPTVFGNVVLLLFASVAFFSTKKYLTIAFLLAGVFIILSGTRTAIIGIFVIYIWKILKDGKWQDVVLASIPIFAFVIVAAFFSNELGDGVARAFNHDTSGEQSVTTRLSWYSDLFSQIKNSYYFGGYGPGSSESYIGYITHSDQLRYWYDYSLIFLGYYYLVIIIFLSSSTKAISYFTFSHIQVYVNIVIISFLLGFHNGLQSPSLLILFGLYIASARHWLTTLPKRS